MELRLISLLLVAVSSLTACSAGLRMTAGNNLFRALPGSEFILHVDIVIPPGRIRASFQGGELVNGASEFEPRCELEVRDFAEAPQTIRAGIYRIIAVRGMDRYVTGPGEHILLAAAGVLQMVSDSSSEWYMNTYQMALHSDMQADAPTLVCGGEYNYPAFVRYPTLQEMLASLGGYASLRLR